MIHCINHIITTLLYVIVYVITILAPYLDACSPWRHRWDRVVCADLEVIRDTLPVDSLHVGRTAAVPLSRSYTVQFCLDIRPTQSSTLWKPSSSSFSFTIYNAPMCIRFYRAYRKYNACSQYALFATVNINSLPGAVRCIPLCAFSLAAVVGWAAAGKHTATSVHTPKASAGLVLAAVYVTAYRFCSAFIINHIIITYTNLMMMHVLGY